MADEGGEEMSTTSIVSSLGGVKLGIIWAASMAFAGLVGNVTSSLSDYKQLQATVDAHKRWQVQHTIDFREWQKDQQQIVKEQRELMRQVSEGLARIEGQLDAAKK